MAIIRLKDNQTVWDFCQMVQGNYDDIIQFMLDNAIDSLDSDLSGRVFEVVYNTNDKIVNNFFLNQVSISTGDISLFNQLYTSPDGEFNSDFNQDFKN